MQSDLSNLLQEYFFTWCKTFKDIMYVNLLEKLK